MSAPLSLVTHVTTAEFPAMVVSAGLPVVVDFWAPRCGPCLQLSPLLEELAVEYDGRLSIVKVNADEEPALTASYGIKSIPALIFYQAGAPRDLLTGLKSAADLRHWIDRHLAA